MNNLDLLFLMFLLSLGSIGVGIFIGFPLGQRHFLGQLGGEYADHREDVKQRAFARLEKAEQAATQTGLPIYHPNCKTALQEPAEPASILDAEVIE